MTNTSNEFAQQLEVLFAELHTVLQNNIENKVTKDELNSVIGHVLKIEANVKTAIKHIHTLDERTQILDARLTKLQNYLQQAQQQQPTTTSVTPTPQSQPQPVSTTSTIGGSTNTNSDTMISLSGSKLAGRTNKKTLLRPQFEIIETHPLFHDISKSEYYNQSAVWSDVMLKNALKLLSNSNAGEIATQTCILIDMNNMWVMQSSQNELSQYATFIMSPNIKTAKKISEILQGYSLPTELLQVEVLHSTLENLAGLDDKQLTQRLTGCHDNTIKNIQSVLKNIIKSKNDSVSKTNTTPPDPNQSSPNVPTEHTPNQGS